MKRGETVNRKESELKETEDRITWLRRVFEYQALLLKRSAKGSGSAGHLIHRYRGPPSPTRRRLKRPLK